MLRVRTLVLLVTVSVALVFAGTAWASYWFFQGYLPLENGVFTRTVLYYQYESATLEPPVYVRESWSSCTHNMLWIFVQNTGNWEGGPFYYSEGCDQNIQDQYAILDKNWGCENPSGDSQVYDNCYAGASP